jgi:hypothetical protein
VATIRYGFHPRCEETVIVRGRNRRGGEVALTVRQPDGTLAQLPIWMTEDQAPAMMVTQIPRLSLACLRELRLELDAWQSLLRDDPRREGDEHAASAAETWPTRPLRAQRLLRGKQDEKRASIRMRKCRRMRDGGRA